MAAIKNSNITPEERISQARLRLLAAAQMGAARLPSKPYKKTTPIPAIAFAFAAGFVAGFFPSISKTLSQEASPLLRLWLTNRMGKNTP
ncbi:hypothetical protein [Nitrosococcus oceani]|uniref:hypothetical protein n=1 Tax=Nitrosococcus oceani TaxID=1229 RepID=UPI0004E8D555|nr:hypothetical protein [Nitrosococcus oceani]KFI22533.1 hypothetical protein HW44_08835 [Nitrosococcus oceani]